MPTLAHVPVVVYLPTGDYEPEAEYVDGVIEDRPQGQYNHATRQQALLMWFVQNQAQWNIRVLPELRVQTSPTRYRVPDVTVFDRDQPIEQILTHPPVAVFEVLSPEDRISRMLRKLADYEAMGIRNLCNRPRRGCVLPLGGRPLAATQRKYRAAHRLGWLRRLEHRKGVGD